MSIPPHTRTLCFPANKLCDVYNFFTPPSEATLPVGPLADGKRYLSRDDLGKGETEGLETIGTRETISTNPELSATTARLCHQGILVLAQAGR